MKNKSGWNRDCETYGKANIKLMSMSKTGQECVLNLSSSEESTRARIYGHDNEISRCIR
jgi:hypothetical protein